MTGALIEIARWASSVGFAALVGWLVSRRKIEGEARQAEGAGQLSLTEAQVKAQENALKSAESAAERAEEARKDCAERMKQHNIRLKARDEATYDLLEVLETVIAPLLPASEKATLHAAAVKMRDAMYD